MKTRIISGLVMIAIVGLILALSYTVSPYFLIFTVAVLCAFSVYELLNNAAGIKSKFAVWSAMVYGALLVILRELSGRLVTVSALTKSSVIFLNMSTFALSAVYFLVAVIVILKNHKDFTFGKIVAYSAFPLFLGFAFSTLESVILENDGIYYLLLLLTFSSVCDMGAYFTGTFFGKHKLCPEISPKKTVEGAVGGIVSAVVFALLFVLLFKHTDKLTATLIVTVPLCIVGMLGDLIASAIKRSVDIKDYGNLIPGHGGILDRVDSILLITPFMYMFINCGVI